MVLQINKMNLKTFRLFTAGLFLIISYDIWYAIYTGKVRVQHVRDLMHLVIAPGEYSLSQAPQIFYSVISVRVLLAIGCLVAFIKAKDIISAVQRNTME